MVESDQLENFVAWAKRRGVIWQSSEIYGGIGSIYDYGPVGVEIKNRLKQRWWREIVISRDDVFGLDSAIIMNPKVWHSSGHIELFNDPLVEDQVTHKRYRLDELEDPTKSPEGNPLGEPTQFNTMFQTNVGPVFDESSTTYLRPETAQGTFVNFKQVMDSSRAKIPFGIAQIGKSFRNEITPGNLTFRTREFEQMELEYFVKPEEADKWFDYWVKQRLQFYVELGLSTGNLRLRKHPKSQLAHYAKATTDIEYKFPWGWGELEGIANRGDYDLLQHQQHSGKDLSVFDEDSKTKYHPYVIEPAGGVDRAMLAILLESWQYYPRSRKGDEDLPEGEGEIVLSIEPTLAAYDAAVLPLVKKTSLVAAAKRLAKQLTQAGQHVFYDESGSIGRRYRRQDEIGTPVCYTVDFESLEGKTKGTVTARQRDSMKQRRVKP